MGENEIMEKLEKWRNEDIKRTNKRYLNNLGLISWGFALAVASQASITPHPANLVIPVIFAILGVDIIYGNCFITKKIMGILRRLGLKVENPLENF